MQASTVAPSNPNTVEYWIVGFSSSLKFGAEDNIGYLSILGNVMSTLDEPLPPNDALQEY
jgi:hypothetical protein